MTYRFNNNTLFAGNALELISNVYKGITINKVFHSPRKIFSKCYTFYTVYRYAFGYTTNDELRKYIINRYPSDTIIPNYKSIPSFIQALIIRKLNEQAENLSEEVVNMFKQFLEPYQKFDGFEITQLADHPITNGCYNRLRELEDQIIKYNSDPEVNLIDSIISMRIQKVDKIVALKRDTSQTVNGLDKL